MYKSPYRWLILTLIILTYTLVIIHRMSPAVMAQDIMADINASATFMGLLASAYFYPYAILQVPSGILSDRISAKKLLLFALIAMSLGTMLFAFATNTTEAFLGRLAVGFGCALILMPAYKVLANWFSKEKYAIIISTLLGVAVGVGAMIAGSPLSALISNYGWRSAMLIICGISASMAFLIFVLFKDKPKVEQTQTSDLNNTEQAEHAPSKTSLEQETEALEKPVTIIEAIKTSIISRNFWILTLSLTTSSAVLFAFVGLWIGIYYMNVVQFSYEQMSQILSVSAMFTIVTPSIFASLSQKSKSRKNVIIYANAALLFLLVYFYMRNGSFGTVEVCIWGVALSTVATSPAGLYMAATREIFPKNISSTASGLGYSICMIGAAIFQPLIGSILESSGLTGEYTAKVFEPICVLYVVTITLTFAATLMLKEKNGKLLQ